MFGVFGEVPWTNKDRPADALQTATSNAHCTEPATLSAVSAQWQTDGRAFLQQMDPLVETLDSLERTWLCGAIPVYRAKTMARILTNRANKSSFMARIS